MKFVAGYWLWSLLLLPIAYAAILFDENRKLALFERFAHRSRWALIAPEMDPNHRIRKARTGLLAMAFAILALARPQFGTHEETVQVTGLDVMVVLDVSTSMETEDVVPNRLQKAKHLIRSLVESLEGDRVGLVAFAGSSYVASPLTTDLSYLAETAGILNPRMIQNQGTDIAVGLETAYGALQRGAVDVVSKKTGSPPSHAVILISDGEDHEGNVKTIAAKFKESGTQLYVLGIGTEKGGPIPIKDENGNPTGYKKDKRGQAVVSTFNPSSLQRIAEAAGGKYWTVTPSENETSALLSDIGALSRSDYAERRYLVYEDRFQIPLFIAVVLLLLEISIPVRKILLLILLFLGPAANAETLRKPASLEAYLENNRGIKAYQEGKIEEAQRNFSSAQARDPLRPELDFNQGVVQLQQGDADHAIESFGSAARNAKERQNGNLFGKSMYNLGHAFAKKGDLKNAVKAYSSAIQSAIERKDTSLEAEARKNLQLLVTETKKQQQQKEQEQQEKKQEQEKEQEQKQQRQKEDQDKKDQNRDKDQASKGKDQQDQKEKGDQKKDQQKNPQYQETQKQSGKQQFQSKKMSPEDADRVMSELKGKERQLQEKLQTRNGRSAENEKDW